MEITLLDEANAPDFMVFQIEKIENGKVEKFPTGITVQAGALKRLAKKGNRKVSVTAAGSTGKGSLKNRYGGFQAPFFCGGRLFGRLRAAHR